MLPCVSVSVACKTLVHPSAAPESSSTPARPGSLPFSFPHPFSRPLSVLCYLQKERKSQKPTNAARTTHR
ncbi:hypothetical protein CTAM01_09299 [Colletotrichum tamarilloi]|uniref:Secreted protein n=1 Tax=Colletotrichum tamarilloi TaxID=1209934 RepID=A0ABQ9R3K7_9PEZI|nr:uncharacterized protein CTAM01_09299 [Colletotrichum tamarilloi]KAK1493838.1 hypothetical protein CTAM01_09299 [Colletotrichum tamarilloi]